MSDYTQITDFSAKDALTTGDPEKIILGSDVDAEFDALATAILSKYDSGDITSSGQAAAASSNVVLMTPGHMLDWADGAMGVSGAGMVGDIARLTDTNADKILFWDDSAGAVAQLATGTFLTITGTTIDFATSGTLPAFNGSALTNLTAANVTGSHTLPDGVLSTNVPLLNAANTFTSTSGLALQANGTLLDINSSNTSGAWVQWRTSGTIRGYFGNGTLITGGSPTVSDISLRAVSGGLFFSGNDGTTAHFALTSAGVLTTPNASAAEAGYKGMPQNSQSVDYTLVLADAGKYLTQTGASKTFTIPANGSVAFPIGTVIFFESVLGTSIAITTDTLYLAGTGYGTTGTRTLAAGGVATAVKRGATSWIISGVGLS